jgi:hypothetical protein
MKIMALKPVSMINDVLCDVCSESTCAGGYGTQFGVLLASWVFGSRHDGERYEVHLCERCFFRMRNCAPRDQSLAFGLTSHLHSF